MQSVNNLIPPYVLWWWSSVATHYHTLDSNVLPCYPVSHVSQCDCFSDTTTNEVIVIILNKFRVVDNPRKFALYERYLESGETVKGKPTRSIMSLHLFSRNRFLSKLSNMPNIALKCSSISYLWKTDLLCFWNTLPYRLCPDCRCRHIGPRSYTGLI